MPESSRDTRQTKPESDKNQPETVQLTAEELKAIAGGGSVSPPPVQSSSNDVIAKRGGVNQPHS